MKTQFERRKAKAETSASVEEVAPATVTPEPVYTNFAYDIYSPDNGRTYKVIEISYNPETGHSRIDDTFEVTRLVALAYENKKNALGILKKGKR